MIQLLIFVSFFLTFNSFAQTINIELKEKHDSIFFIDQSLRELLDNDITETRKTKLLELLSLDNKIFYSNPWAIINHQDSINQEKIIEIISKYGYPGKSLVGEPSNETAWYVIQHSQYIENYFPIIKKAGEEGELPNRLVAMMEDRLLMNKGEEQLYGTQCYGKEIIDKNSGEKKWIYFIWPIKEPEKVNSRRKALGFETTVEQNAKRLGVDYKIHTLEEIIEMLK